LQFFKSFDSETLELLHIDLFGSTRTTALNYKIYGLTINYGYNMNILHNCDRKKTNVDEELHPALMFKTCFAPIIKLFRFYTRLRHTLTYMSKKLYLIGWLFKLCIWFIWTSWYLIYSINLKIKCFLWKELKEELF
jgi:hypothetical protein